MFSRSREAIRVKVQKHENKLPVELRKFSVDPQITSLDELRKILETAFDLRGDFTLSYKSIDGCGQEEYLALLSDWDLEAAFLRAQNASCLAGSEPCIHLKVDVKSYNSASVDNSDMQKNEIPVKHSGQTQRSPLSAEPPFIQNADTKHTQTGFQGIFMNHMEKTINLVSRAFNLSEDPDAPPRPPLKQEEFLSFLGPVGHVIQGSKLREVIYSGGIDPGCRKVIWKHILNVYPEGMSGKERLDYMKKKSAEYYSLRDVWRDCSQKEPISSDLAYVTNMVRKDVLRTDRHHKFYSGSDDNQNITFLFNILTTYALNHPTVSYCQGMSDLASPLLVVMSDEAHAYICLCALMKRLHYNFLLDGEAMTLKFSHLSESLQTYDPIFYAYLQSQQADDLLFCYRWLLLEMKREFAFEDALHMLEVLWSSLPPSPPTEELLLVEKEFCPEEPSTNSEEPPASPLLKTPRENVYTKLCAIRRQSSSYSITSSTKGRVTYRRKNLSLDESIGKANFNPQLQISKEFQSLDETCVNLNEGFCSHHINNDEFKEETQSQLILNKDTDFKNIFSQEPLKLNGTLRNMHRKSQNNDLLRTAVNNKLLSNIDVNNQNNVENDSENVSKKLVKNLAEFNNFFSNKKKDLDSLDLNNSESNEHQQHSGSGSENIKADSDLSDSDVDLFIPDVEKCVDQTNQENFEIFSAPESQSNQTSPLENNDNFSKTFNLLTITDKDDKQLSSKTISSFSIKLKNDKNPFENFQISDKNDVFIWENPLHGKCDIKKMNNFHKFAEGVDKLQDSNDEVFVTEDSTSLDKKTDEQDDISKEIDKKSKISRNAMRSNSKFFSNMSQELENAKKNCEILLSNKRCTNLQTIASTITNFQKKYELQNQTSVNANDRVNSTSNSCEEVDEANATKSTVLNLPPANLFGGGNPFLIFLCLTVLIQHRDYIMRSQMDYNELAMYFDKMVRKHNVHRVLNQARRMYSAYLKEQNSNVNS